MALIDNDFLLTTDVARHLYHDVAAQVPIVDYHCHIPAAEIAQDRRFANICEVWLGGDHYKWRLMRANGVDESLVTGDAPARDRFQAFCETMERAIGNPVYQWSTLELRRYFGYEGAISGATAQEIWELANAKLAEPDMSARGLVTGSNVALLCTTDDPADSLEFHEQIAADESFAPKVLPAWRPDAAMGVDRPGFGVYLERLGDVSGVRVDGLDGLRQALSTRLDFFEAHGASISDHSLDFLMFEPADEAEVERIVRTGMAGESVSQLEKYRYWTWLMLFLSGEYARRGWAMQLHYGVQRNVNSRMFARLGGDTGYDCASNHTPATSATALLDAMASGEGLPKTILYSLNPADNLVLDTICGCFQEGPAVGKIQHGAAWWFNDHYDGMREQMRSLASQGLLGNFIGMLTDSRSFLSYPRHEYFRRVLCGLIGEWVELGMYPDDDQALSTLVRDISYNNAVRYFGLPLDEA